VEVAAIGVQLVIGKRAVGVDPINHLLGQEAKLLGSEGCRKPGQQFLAVNQVRRIKAAVVDLAQRPLDDRHLFWVDVTGPLGGTQMGSHRWQRLTKHAGPLADCSSGPDSPGGLARRQAKRAHQGADQCALRQGLRKVAAFCVGDDPMVG
jgi:hypothetical protein